MTTAILKIFYNYKFHERKSEVLYKQYILGHFLCNSLYLVQGRPNVATII